MVVVRQASGVLEYLAGARRMTYSDARFLRMLIADRAE